MAEKKSINLFKLLLIIAVVIIIVLSVIIFMLSSKTDKKPEKNDEDSKTDSPVITTKDTLTQLSGEFFDIKSIIKESVNNYDIENAKEFNYDLDSDGKIDKITLKHIVNKNEEEYSYNREYYILEYNGKAIYDHWDGSGTVGIVDLDSSDKYLDIWVYDEGPSNDPVYFFYRKVEDSIVKLGHFSIDRGFVCDGKGKVLAAGINMPWINPQVYNSYYTIDNNIFKKHNLDFSYNKDYEYTTEDGFFTTDLENLKKFENDYSVTDGDKESLIALGKKYNINILDKDTKFKIIEFAVKDIDEYSMVDLKVVLSDGTVGYLIHPYGRFYIYG